MPQAFLFIPMTAAPTPASSPRLDRRPRQIDLYTTRSLSRPVSHFALIQCHRYHRARGRFLYRPSHAGPVAKTPGYGHGNQACEA
jgi:hypothetical protein